MIWLYDMPTSLMVVLLSGVFIGFAWIGAIFVRPFLRALMGRQPEMNDLVGYILSCHCVFFGLLLGLLAVGTYQNMSDVDKPMAHASVNLMGCSSFDAAHFDIRGNPVIGGATLEAMPYMNGTFHLGRVRTGSLGAAESSGVRETGMV